MDDPEPWRRSGAEVQTNLEAITSGGQFRCGVPAAGIAERIVLPNARTVVYIGTALWRIRLCWIRNRTQQRLVQISQSRILQQLRTQ